MCTGSLGTTAALLLSLVGHLVLSENEYQNKKELGISHAVQTGLDKLQRKSDYSERSDIRKNTCILAINVASKRPSKLRLHDPGDSTLHVADINQHER
jgi:hypothetical protein